MRKYSSPTSFQRDWLRKPSHAHLEEDHGLEEESPKLLCVPYVRGVSEELEKVCTYFGVKVVSKPQITMRDMLMKVKEKIPMALRMQINLPGT